MAGPLLKFTVQSDPNGIATLDHTNDIGRGVYVYYHDGPFTVVASIPEGARATFSLTVAAARPHPPLPGATVTISSGNNQSVPLKPEAGSSGAGAMFQPLQVVVRDVAGNPIPNAMVDLWPGDSQPGMVVQVLPSSEAPATVLTDRGGVATFAAMKWIQRRCVRLLGPPHLGGERDRRRLCDVFADRHTADPEA